MGRFLWFLLFVPISIWGQNTGTIRGKVFDQANGEPIAFANVQLFPDDQYTTTDLEGLFSFADVPAGAYELVISYLGYDSLRVPLTLEVGVIKYQAIYLQAGVQTLTTVDVSGQRERARSDVTIANLQINPTAIRTTPSIGGQGDIVQYLSSLPGIVSSGDQGGQVYIRGGSPVQNKILLDGATIYNPFHSVGLFSVFETEALATSELYTAGFPAIYGGRTSAVLDLQTRPGNRRQLAGQLAVSPFQAKVLVEGPLLPLKTESGNSISFLLTAKQGLIDATSQGLYQYAIDTSFFAFADSSDTQRSDLGLPYDWRDFYGKVTFSGRSGSQLDLFGFQFTDAFSVPGSAELEWTTTGGGTQFQLLPPNADLILNGSIAYSDYGIELRERDEAPRSSGIRAYSTQLDFIYFGTNSELRYGFRFEGFDTDFRFRNPIGITFSQEDFTSELAAFIQWKIDAGKWLLEPGFRMHFYTSQNTIRPEPRLAIKYRATRSVRLKAGAGLYSQNLIGTLSDLDVVNFFVGFLAGPEESLFDPVTGLALANNLQLARHALGGLEIDLGKFVTLNAEVYYKDFNQLIQLDRNKREVEAPDFQREQGRSYGGDISIQYSHATVQLRANYTYGRADRTDEEQRYPTSFDRRHQVNLLGTIQFGAQKRWEASLRWNFGSPFPFTQTQGFYQGIPIERNPVVFDVLTGNYDLEALLSETINGGRLVPYHRLDGSITYRLDLSRSQSIRFNASVTNMYDRANVFYLDRTTSQRVDQLPILPTLGIEWKF